MTMDNDSSNSYNLSPVEGRPVNDRYPRLYTFLNRLLVREDIDGQGRCEYLHRWWLRHAKSWGAYLHHFVYSDWSRVFHNHPRRFVSIGLYGRYFEERPDGSVIEYRAPWIRTFPASHIHRVVLREGETCWTLVIVFKAVLTWGFFPDGKFMHWKQYVNSPRADEDKIC